MKLELVNISVVILAENLNPALVQDGYLKAGKVIPDDLAIAESSVSTPILSVIQYVNGLTFTAQENKLQIQDNNPTPAESNLSPIAIYTAKYLQWVQKMSDIHYTAVGINLVGFIETANAERFLLEKFILPKSANSQGLKPISASPRFAYMLTDAKLNLYFDPGTITRTGESEARPGVMVSANYHSDVEQQSLREVRTALGRFTKRYLHFNSVIKNIFGLED